MDLHEIFSKGGTWDKEQPGTFRDVVVDPLNPGLIILFPGSVIVNKIMENRWTEFSWNFHKMSGTTQEIII